MPTLQDELKKKLGAQAPEQEEQPEAPIPKQIEGISEKRRSRAPYNFIPLNETVIPGQIYKKIDRYDLKRHTGYIQLEITTLTPIYIRDTLTEAEYKAGKTSKHATDFYKPGGKRSIPGSSLRGLVRQLMEIVTWSKISTDRARVFHYRSFADMSSLRDEYKKKMNPEGEKTGRSLYAMNAGYLRKKGTRYQIIPAQKGSGDKYQKIASKQFYQIHKDDVSNLPRDSEFIDYFFKSGDEYVIISGRMHNKEHDWIVNPIDSHAKPIPIDELDIRDYLLDTDRRDYNVIGTLKEKNLDFVPCFYVEWTNTQKRKRISFGHTPLFRLAYENSIGDLLPEAHKEPETVDISESIFGRAWGDEPIAGRVYFEDAELVEGQENFLLEKNIHEILASPKPTTFQHYLVQPSERAEDLCHYNSETIIRGHKAYWHRKRQGMVTELVFDYNRFVEHLRLKRIYIPNNLMRRRRNKAVIPDFSAIKDQSIRIAIFEFILNDPNSQYSVITPIKAGTKFKSKICFENLNDLEFGALLSVMEVLENHYLKIGMGKPLGFGSIQFTTTVFLSERQNRYISLQAEWTDSIKLAEEKKLNRLKTEFENSMWKQLSDHDKEGATSFWETYRLKQLKTILDWSHTNANDWNDLTRYLRIAHPEKNNEYIDRQVLPIPEEVTKHKKDS